MSTATLYYGDVLDVLRTLPEQSVRCCVTSPPYWGLRDYGQDAQLGLERTPEEYVAKMVDVFREVRRVLTDDGTLWLNLGDSYATGAGSYRNPGSDVKPIEHGGKQAYTRDYARAQPNRMPIDGLKPKDLVGIPWRVAFALQVDGWWLRSDIVWSKPNPMPESVKDRPTRSHEYVFLLSKSARYFYDAEAIAENLSCSTLERWSGPPLRIGAGAVDVSRNDRDTNGGEKTLGTTGGSRNARTVWEIATQPYPAAHFATFPEELARRCILAGSAKAGKRCDCNEIVDTPIGTGMRGVDPSQATGRAGFNRPRRGDEGSRPITRGQQRHYARQLRDSTHRSEMVKEAGSAFDHYIRTDRSGARPVPPTLLHTWLDRGWIEEAPIICSCPICPADTVLDPFGGSGTVAQVATGNGRSAIYIDLNPGYLELARQRIGPMFCVEPCANSTVSPP